LKCPHPDLALTSTAGPKEVWWFNAFASQEERDGLAGAYARNEPLMAAMRPLGRRKEDFRETFTSTMTAYRRDLSGDNVEGARILVVDAPQDYGRMSGAVFETVEGKRFVIVSAHTRVDAEDRIARSGPLRA
jgi:hypothetical protein